MKTNDSPLVSIVVIFFNAEKFFSETLNSIIGQTYQNWELLLVDDGSTDRSTKIALEYCASDPKRIFYFKHAGHQNRGMSASRNLGISNAKGEYVALLDADDAWLPHKLEQQVGILNSHPEAGMVYGLSHYWYGWTGKPEDTQRDFTPEFGVEVNTLYKPPTLLPLAYPLGTAADPCPSDLLLRREVVKRVGGFEESFRGMYEDQAFLTKVYLREPVFVASECWNKYRMHPNSCTAVATETGHLHSARLLFLNWLAQYLSEQEAKDAEVWKRLREEQLIAQVRAHAQKREWKRTMQAFWVLLRYHPQAFIRAYQKLRQHLRLRGRLRLPEGLKKIFQGIQKTL